VQRHSSLAIPAATITLVGTNTETVTSPDGSFGLLPLVPGRYTVVVTDTTLGQYARARSTELTADVTRGRFTDDSGGAAAAHRCHSRHLPR
jgi:hypothetical protein